MRDLAKSFGYLAIGAISSITRGALVALYWNWFVRDELFTTAPTLTVWLGVAVATLASLATFQFVPDKDMQEQWDWVVSYTFTAYAVAAIWAVVLHGIIS